ncbi:hypothetical protein AM469_006184, partial [Pseudomonas aeruginosa]
VEIGRRHVPLGAAFMNGPNSGKDVFVPLEYIIGGQEMIGKGWMMLMKLPVVGRSISLPAVGTSAGKASSYVSGRYRDGPRAVQRADRRLRRHPGGACPASAATPG